MTLMAALSADIPLCGDEPRFTAARGWQTTSVRHALYRALLHFVLVDNTGLHYERDVLQQFHVT
jgi:hypothetical protein